MNLYEISKIKSVLFFIKDVLQKRNISYKIDGEYGLITIYFKGKTMLIDFISKIAFINKNVLYKDDKIEEFLLYCLEYISYVLE